MPFLVKRLITNAVVLVWVASAPVHQWLLGK